MTTAALNKLRTIHYDTNGKPEAVTLNLKNKTFRKFYEVMMEDYLDTIAVKQSMRNDDGTRYELKFHNDDTSFTLVEIKQ